MPKGTNGQKRPAGAISASVMIGKIATGKASIGMAGAAARAKTLTPEQRTEIAKKAASARWE